MKLFALKPTQELVDDHESHFNKIMKTGRVQVIDTITDQFEQGLIFRSTDQLQSDNSLFFKEQQYTYQYMSGLKLPLFNHDYVVLDESSFSIPFTTDSFVKPNNRLKCFQPTILKKGESVLSLGLSTEEMSGLEVVVASVKNITDVIEIRSIIFNGTLCSMAVTSHEDKSIKISADTIKFILKVIRRLPKKSTTVLDIAVKGNDISIVEFNPLETSGFFLDDYKRTMEIFSEYELPSQD